MLIATILGRGVFKAVALLGAFVLIIAVWFWDAALLTTAADQNLRLVKVVTGFCRSTGRAKAKARCESSGPITRFC
jgi:hypothetical protein